MNDEHPDHAAFGAQWWENHYQEGTSCTGEPSPLLVAELTGLPAGTALDAGCGEGSAAIWLAQQGWDVTAIDISPTAIRNAETFAASEAPEIAQRVTWNVADLNVWESSKEFDLVVSQYVHPGSSFSQFVSRLAQAVGPGGTLFVVGHDHADTHSATHAPEDASIETDAVTAALHEDRWSVEVAETRAREVEHGSKRMTFHDLVVKAHRKKQAPV